MKNRSTFPNVVRTLSFIVGVLALALFTQLTVSHADPSTPRGASTLGDFVWHDSNVNGTKDESVEWGSSGIDGVVVKLYLDDNDGVFEPGGDDTLVNTLTTGDDSSTTGVEHGWYDFLSITANGNIYWVEIPDSNFASGGALEHYVYTGDLASEDYSGEEPRVVILSDPIMDYNNADFGYALPGIKLIKVADSAPDGTIDYINSGDDVQYTYTITNTGETHLSDIVIRDDNGTAGNTADDFTVCTITGPLAPNASQSCTHTVTNVTADVTNIATVTANPTSSDGTDLPGDNVTDSDDADVVLYASLGDYVWEDTDADGVQDAGESPIQGVTVKLYKDVDGDGVAEPGADDGAAIATDTTDASGLYGFDDLVPGDYFVQFTKPTGYDKASPSTAGSASDPTDSDADETTGLTDVTTLSSGENDPTWDAGFYKYAKLGDYVWEDTDADGVQDAGESPIQGVTVKLYKDVDGDGVAEPGADDGAAIATDTTDASGLYEFDNLVPGDYFVQFTKPTGYDKASPSTAGSASDPTDSDADATTGLTDVTTLISGENDPTWDAGFYKYAKLGDYVWEDKDADGVQDAGESPIQGVTVKLYKDVDGDGVAEPGADDGAAIATDTTDASGLYEFDNLVPGDYFVQFTKPTGYDKASPSTAGSASDPTDSDADATTGLTDVTTLISGENDPTWDAGFYKYAKLGDYVWEDKDADGVQDTGESAIQGVTVKLYKDVDGDGVAEPGADDGAAIATDTTDASGLYEFDDLVPGDYFVQFTKPTGYDKASPSTAGSASDPTDSDADATTGVTNVTTLDSGENDPTWDAGFYKLASLGDKVWWDLNEDGIQDAGEPGIKGVTVTLKDGSGTTIATDITDANGDYSFTDLEPGNYSVVFTKPNNDWTISPKEQGTDDAKDSNADTATGQTDTTTLSSGEDDDTVDAGMSIPSSYTITKKNTTAASELTPGDPISFTITIKNTGKTWLAVLPLRDTYDTTYLAYVNADTASDDNVDDGTIDWTDLTASYGNDLAPGASFSVVVNFTAKHHTQNLPNHETINTATAHDVMTDPDGPTGPNGATGPLPNQSDDDPVTILNPVGESMSSFAALVAGNAVQIRWQSASEASILGFNMLRSANGGSFEQVNDSLIFAQYAGADLGASYRFVDRSVSDDSYNYVLEIVFLDGSVAHYGAVQVNLDTSF